MPGRRHNNHRHQQLQQHQPSSKRLPQRPEHALVSARVLNLRRRTGRQQRQQVERSSREEGRRSISNSSTVPAGGESASASGEQGFARRIGDPNHPRLALARPAPALPRTPRRACFWFCACACTSPAALNTRRGLSPLSPLRHTLDTDTTLPSPQPHCRSSSPPPPLRSLRRPSFRLSPLFDVRSTADTQVAPAATRPSPWAVHNPLFPTCWSSTLFSTQPSGPTILPVYITIRREETIRKSTNKTAIRVRRPGNRQLPPSHLKPSAHLHANYCCVDSSLA